MNATTEAPEVAETAESRLSATERARIVCELLKEYAAKLEELNAELLEFSFSSTSPVRHAQRAAWLLDRTDLLRKPLSNIISSGSALLEYSSPDAIARMSAPGLARGHSSLDSLTADELALRMREIEIHLHHTLRLAHELRQSLDNAKLMDQIKKLRVAAGLNAMKGGPLDPD